MWIVIKMMKLNTIMKKILPGLSIVAGTLFLAACASDTENIPIQTTEETKLSSDSIMTEKNTEPETTEAITPEKMSRIKKLVRTAGYVEGESKLSEKPTVSHTEHRRTWRTSG